MKFKFLGLILIFITPLTVLGYNSADYYPDFVPYNYDEAAEADFPQCNDVLRSYEKIYQAFETEWNDNNYSGGDAAKIDFESEFSKTFSGATVNKYAQLKNVAEEQLRLCLIDYRAYLIDKEESDANDRDIQVRAAARDCDFNTIDQMDNAERAKYSDLIDACYAQIAIDTCDLEAIEEFDNATRMAHYDSILNCMNSETIEVEETQPVESVNITTQPVYVPPPEPTAYIPPQQTAAPVASPDANETTPEDEPEIATTTEATTTPEEALTVTEEELDRIVQERVSEVLANEEETQPKPEPEKPSIFKRVFNFLFGWL